MTYWTMEALNQAMEKMEGCIEGRLYLPGYVALEPANAEAEKYLDLLEKEGYLPPTVSWLCDQGMKSRLYLAPDGAYSFDVKCDGMALEIRNGADDCVLVKSQRMRGMCHKIHGDASFLITNPTKLPAVTFEFLRLLALMGKGANSILPREV